MGKNKASGTDNVPLEAYFHGHSEIKKNLVLLFNKCLEIGNIPLSWKESKLFLLFKGGKETAENFRPIALLNSIYKIFGALMNKRLNLFINNKNLIHSHQSGFQKFRSTSTRIWTLISIIRHQRTNNKELKVLYLDIKKAYDSLEHWALKETLELIGFPKKFCSLIKNMYNGTSFSISTLSGDTNQIEITRGVKQGCPMSPTLFILFIEPLLSWLEEKNLGIAINDTIHTVGGFADDLVITTETHENMVASFAMINEFVNYYNLKINIDNKLKNKTVYTSFTPNSNLVYIKVNNEQIEIPYMDSSSSYRYLGIQLNLDLNWDKQRTIVWSTFQKQISFLHNRCITTKQLIKILNTVIVPSISYGLQFYSFPKRWVAKIERQLALLLSKHIHIPEASPLHFQRPHKESSFNLQSVKVSQRIIPYLSLIRTANGSNNVETTNIIISTLECHLEEFELPPEISRIWKNPYKFQRENINRINWVLYDYELTKKLNNMGITSLKAISNNNYLHPYQMLRKLITRCSNGRKSLSVEEYDKLRFELCNEDSKLKRELVNELEGIRSPTGFGSEFITINNWICVFTDASEDEFSTSYAVYAGRRNPFNISKKSSICNK